VERAVSHVVAPPKEGSSLLLNLLPPSHR